MRAHKALKLLGRGKPLVEATIDGVLNLRELGKGGQVEVYSPIKIENCVLLRLEAPLCTFHRPVVLRRARVLDWLVFCGSFFLAGLHIIESEVLGGGDFSSGGHNRDEIEIALEGTRFVEFVDFFDCLFEGPVRIRDCHFEGGTNLLSGKCLVAFKVPPLVERNTGQLGLERR